MLYLVLIFDGNKSFIMYLNILIVITFKLKKETKTHKNPLKTQFNTIKPSGLDFLLKTRVFSNPAKQRSCNVRAENDILK